MPFVILNDVCKEYRSEEVCVRAAHKVSFTIEKGEFVIVAGPSGAGKTTVLNLLGGMDRCDSGEIIVDGQRIDGLNRRGLTHYRREDIGFVFQFYNLVQNLTAVENIELATELCKSAASPMEMLHKVGMADRADHFPAQLSGGEQQRVSIARALCKNPALLLCDEPTGALDSKTGEQVLELLTRLCRDYSTTVVIITHNAAIAPLGNRIIRLKNGMVQEVVINEHPIRVEEIQW